MRAIKFIEAAAEEIGVKTAEIALETHDALLILNRMNDMLFEWRFLFLTPRFEELTDLQDEVAVDPEANAAIKYNLALHIVSAFQQTANPALIATAGSALERLRIISMQPIDVDYPDTLPLGSGNQCYNFNQNRRFFGRNSEENF